MSLVLVILATIASFQAQFSVLAQQNKFKNCSTVFQCGNITGIGYPWWDSSRPSYCGHPDFRLNCSRQTATVSMSGLTYQVLEIDIPLQILTLARTDYLTGICPLDYHNDSIDATLFSYSEDDNLNVTIYYGCSSIPRKYGNVSGLSRQINCTINNKSLRSGYYAVAYLLNTQGRGVADPIYEDLDNRCLNRVVVPANQSAVLASLSNVTAPDEDRLVGVLGRGFELVWDADKTDNSCFVCKDSGGACGYNNGTFHCYCSDREYPLRCNDSSPSPSPSQLPISPPPPPDNIDDYGDSTDDYSSPLQPPSQPSSPPPGKGTPKMVIAGSSAAGSVILVCLLIGLWFLIITRKKRKRHSDEDAQKSRQQNEAIKTYIINYQSQMPQRYSYSDIKKMTKKFAHKLGQGGFGGVYKGELPDGRLVAVKVLHTLDNQGEEFLNEVASIGRTSHVNIVSLLGYCYDKKKALVYQYMPKSSLDKYIYQQESKAMECALEWNVLYDIAIGAARGLEYLHRGCNTRIVHLDIKPHNILLDEDFCPKISDFGLAKLCKGKESKVSMLGTRGTPGYIAPEVFSRNFGAVSYKSDVYSYGMLVLEMVGARKNFDNGSSKASEKYFPDWIYEQLEQDEISCLGREIAETKDQVTARKMILVGLWCIQTKPIDRPNMSKVIEMLEDDSRTLPVPPKPNLNLPGRSTPQNSSAVSLGPYTSSGTNEEEELQLEASVESQLS